MLVAMVIMINSVIASTVLLQMSDNGQLSDYTVQLQL